MALLHVEDLERDDLAEQTKAYVLAERQCRIALAEDWPRIIPLEWHPGKIGKRCMIPLHPGKFVVQPLSKAQCWFGPFAVYFEIRTETDEKKRQQLRALWKSEKDRYLNRYDYPRGDGRGVKPVMAPSGPHRSPDVTVTILDPDGTESEPIRLYELYRIGDFDALKDSFVAKESVEQVEARYQAELAAVNERYEREVLDFRMQLAEIKGMFGAKVASDGTAAPKEVRLDSAGRPRDPITGRLAPREASDG